jgi:uncharacterized protein
MEHMHEQHMAGMALVAIYVAINIALLLFLAIRVIPARIKHKVTLGDGGVEAVQQVVRAHGNAVEYIPPVLIGLVVLAFLNAPAHMIHIIGGALTLGRMFHAFGLSNKSGQSFGRAAGSLLTWLSMLGVVIGLGWMAWQILQPS